jgi:hypothetical protein
MSYGHFKQPLNLRQFERKGLKKRELYDWLEVESCATLKKGAVWLQLVNLE